MQDKINEIKNDVEDLTKETESLYKLAIDTMETTSVKDSQ